jgi:hypothetical protein
MQKRTVTVTVGRHESARWFGPLWRNETTLWVVGCLGFVAGDLVTTSVGLGLEGVTELHPLASPPHPHSVLVTMLVLKLAVVGVAYLVWKGIQGPHRLGIPLGLALVGVLVTAWNLSVLARAGL